MLWIGTAPTHDSAGLGALEDGDDDEGRGVPSKSDITADSLEPLTSDEYRLKYSTHVHRLPHEAKAMDYALYMPKAMRMFFLRLTDAFGFKVRHAGTHLPLPKHL